MISSRLAEATRRQFLQLSAAGVGTASLSGWMPALARAAESQPRRKAKHCILLWMDGGPSHKDTFDLKPDSKGAGDFKPIKTSVAGVEISEHLPKLAQLMHKGAIVRGMSTPEGDHGRAKYHLHTGYREGQGGMVYPSLGAIVGSEIGSASASIPSFVSIGSRGYGSGYLGPKHQPLMVSNATAGVEDLKGSASDTQLSRRLGMLEQMEGAFGDRTKADVVADHRATYERAVKLMHSAEAKAFDLGREPAAARAKYGTGRFADGALMARRLVEVGVPFVEVNLGGWDTHERCWERVRTLSEQVDAGASALIGDLQERGLLDDTLIVWMGEFGRTPHINSRSDKPGRDHYAKAWSLAMWGGGLRGGAVLGRTDKEGAVVEDGRTGASDFLATVCELMGIDHAKKNETPSGRPVALVEKATPFTAKLL